MTTKKEYKKKPYTRHKQKQIQATQTYRIIGRKIDRITHTNTNDRHNKIITKGKL